MRAKVGIPLAVKLLPFFSTLGNFVQQLQSSGVDGVVLFNRYIRPDFDLDTLSLDIEALLSGTMDLYLPITWTALLSRRVTISLAAGNGVDSYVEIVKLLLAGANVVTTASSLLRHGPRHMATLIEGLERWLSENSFASVDEVRGRLDATHVGQAEMLFRSEYLHTLADYAAQHPAALAH